MTSRFARLCLALLVPALAARAFGQTPATPAQPPLAPGATAAAPQREEEVTIKLPDADLDTILTALEIYTGKVILRPAQLPTSTYNLKTNKPIPKSDAIRYLETVLALNSISLVPLDEKSLKVVPITMARVEAPMMITGSAFDYPPSGQVGTKLFQLEFLRVPEFQQMLAQILNPNFGGPVVPANANAVLITDSISNLQRVETLMREVDKPVMAGLKPRFYQLLNGAKASDIVNKIRTVISGSLQQQIGTGTSFSADDRTNQVILIADPRQYEFFDDLIRQLDQRADPNTRNDVIYLKHAKAEEVVAVLTKIISGQSQAIQRQGSGATRSGLPGVMTPPGGLSQPQPAQPQPNAPTVNAAAAAAVAESGSNEFSQFMTVVNDDRSNSVVVSGTADDIRLVRELVAKLDIVLAQVRIEVVIAEVTLRDNNESGISQLGLQVEGDKLVGFGASGPGFGIGGTTADSFATITRPGTTGPWDLAGIINLGTTERKDNTTILSRPSITTSHAKEATVFVGETRPVITGSVISGVGGGTTSTTTQLQIGINLVVTPLIGVDGSVQLDIKQDVDEVGPTVIIDNNEQPIIFKRTTASFVSVKSGEIIVLGGLQRRSNVRKTNRLGPIPIIGDLLGDRQRAESRTELVFFLRPHVLTNTPADNAPAMERIETLPHKEQIKEALDPNYQPAPKSVLDKILPR